MTRMPTDIKVMTYNIQLGAGSDSMPRYILDWLSVSLARPHCTENLEKIIENIKAISPDILAITESEEQSVRSMFINYNEMIKETLNLNFEYFPTHHKYARNGFRKKSQSNAIFVKPEHKITGRGNLYFEKSEQRRCIGRCDIEVKTNEDRLPVSVFVTHLSVSKKYRPKQIEEVIEFTRKASGLVILTGDFNIKRDESELSVIREYFREAGPLGTWPSWKSHIYAMDRIFVSNEFHIVDKFAPKVSGSDHLPLVAILQY